MLADTMEEMETKLNMGIAKKHFHKMGASQWDYNRMLAKWANLPDIPNRVEKLYNDVHDYRRKNLVSYKSNGYFLNSDTGDFCMR